MEQKYISGMGKESLVPEEIKGWSWGAFLLNWIWGIGNSTYLALLMFVPVVNLVFIFILGAKGNEWAWRNRTWRDVEHFKATQKKWRNAGLILILVIFPLFFISVTNLLKGDAYEFSLDAVKSDPRVISLVGENLEPGLFVMGQISYSGSEGEADLNYSIEGEKSEAVVYVYATNLEVKWELQELLVVSKETGEKIVVLTQSGEGPIKN